jgi:hypothetical protein
VSLTTEAISHIVDCLRKFGPEVTQEIATLSPDELERKFDGILSFYTMVNEPNSAKIFLGTMKRNLTFLDLEFMHARLMDEDLGFTFHMEYGISRVATKEKYRYPSIHRRLNVIRPGRI